MLPIAAPVGFDRLQHWIPIIRTSSLFTISSRWVCTFRHMHVFNVWLKLFACQTDLVSLPTVNIYLLLRLTSFCLLKSTEPDKLAIRWIILMIWWEIDLFCFWFICNAIKNVENSWANKVDSSVCADQFEALTYPPPAGNPSGKLPGKPPGIWTFEDYFDQILAPGEAFYILTKL